jgi:hypothetical protein
LSTLSVKSLFIHEKTLKTTSGELINVESCSIQRSSKFGDGERYMSEQLLLESVPLNALDRCDRCGAQAYVRAVLLNGGELMFCAHHGKEYAEKLKPIAAKIHDESEKLIENQAR